MSLTEKIEHIVYDKPEFRWLREPARLYDAGDYLRAKDSLDNIYSWTKNAPSLESTINFMRLSIGYNLSLKLPTERETLNDVWRKFDAEAFKYISELQSGMIADFAEEARKDIIMGRKYIGELLKMGYSRHDTRNFAGTLDIMKSYLPESPWQAFLRCIKFTVAYSQRIPF